MERPQNRYQRLLQEKHKLKLLNQKCNGIVSGVYFNDDKKRLIKIVPNRSEKLCRKFFKKYSNKKFRRTIKTRNHKKNYDYWWTIY